MDLGLSNRVALICGGSSGLGYAVAARFLAEGAQVALNARTPARLDTAVSTLAALGSVQAFAADISVPPEAAALVRRVRERMGGPDILFCNAGGPPAGRFESHPPEAWQRALDTNLLATIHLCRAAVPLMRQGRWGRILCLTSVAAKQPTDALILSTTARAGVLGFAKSLADEVARDGITVNVLCPGYFATERLRELAETRGRSAGRSAGEILAEMGQMVPLGRIGAPEELAAAAVFLASEPARYITGTALSVDGGATRAIL